MQSTPNYLWQPEDILGQGATANVYRARNKMTGELVAVKVFNNVSYLRPYEVQMREFDMLRKLNHKNIVRLFAVEECGSSKQKVLVMEYCSSGSLLTVLEEPENAFGLSEPEFLIVLQSVVAGMNHLRENGVVHRDIKPGNIMRLMGEEGQSIYKLTDFGAARELDDDEKFVSVYGTEEYLHPDMYERAVLKKPQQKAYGVTVDLWSIGVTFYHAATGSLPFLPFGGPRRNKEMMHKITTEKPRGAIAGVQRKENGSIEWMYELPITCRLSAGLKSQLVAILPNILEVDQQKCWGFDQFFAETSDILHRIVFYVFSLQQASMHTIYIHSYNTTAIFLDAVFKQTRIAPQHQLYFQDGHLCVLEQSLPAQQFCHTSEQNPLVLVSTEMEAAIGVIYRDPALDFPKFIPSIDTVADCSTAKNVLSAGHQTLRITQSLLRCRELLLKGAYWMIEYLKAACERKHEVSLLLAEMKALALYGNVASPELKDESDLKSNLQTISGLLSSSSQSMAEKQSELGSLRADWLQHQQEVHEDRSFQRIENCLEKMQQIYKQFRKSRMQPRLPYNDEQIHKLDKVNLGTLAKKVLSVFQDECVQKYRTALAAHSIRMRTMWEISNDLKLLSSSIAACRLDLEECHGCLENVLARLPDRLQRVPVPQAPAGLCQTPKDVVLGMQQLLHEIKAVARDLQQNNSIIERLDAVPPTPGM
ncbi:inhibitor of nuclear factor kappa-B kinase subunit epsilon isoform X1 [Rhinatrema bivittatum]|uniref:inhibitor of nuclear factor kappa-B kinase subunit epsilon isoform X1 n=1 Tax=Rhinatrema bivittatum TaxID=194408 RepID=UPI00112E66D8|nr:inhibitor of nuclear factor kappa-B kinase subunit epsilon isoform X1 [Rhinatrema bivittatum]XP_029428292.1 inhibitor of nuclear factor kappa-B kinase subunit epsilon isoform X1 [Rhinatrema bivittatum]XP_029428293.1 inhibitor of nuclear factor kappa-B kinase subunit epsilon isoform X1 [Rhinatrema bivittatum]